MRTLCGAGEIDVREDLISPLLNRLGYFRGGLHNLTREMPLRYAKEYLGRKKKGDRPLLGFADYVLDAGRKVRWTLETKPPVAISQDDIEQAFSYARHPEVNGQYFVLCNGLEFIVYQTAYAPNAAPILATDVNDIEKDFDKIAAILAPDAVLREFPQIVADTTEPLAPGLGSITKVLSGWWFNHTYIPPIPRLTGLTTSISGGVIQRYEDGLIGIAINTVAAFKQIQDLNDSLGLGQIEMKSSASTLSTSSNHPTRFELSQTIHFPAGVQLFDLTQFAYVTNHLEMNATTTAVALASVDGDKLTGPIESRMQLAFENGQEFNVIFKGSFSLQLAIQ